MKEDMCEVIAEYENMYDIQEEDRCTEYNTDFGFYIFKMSVNRYKINERFAEAKEAKEGSFLSDGRKVYAVLSVPSEGNGILEVELQDEDSIITEFMNTDVRDKKLGIKLGEDTYYVLHQQKGCPVELLTLPLSGETKYIARIDAVRCRWLRKIYEKERAGIDVRVEDIVNKVDDMLKQEEKFNYLKEINAKMRTVKKVFFNENMSGYDFRGVDLTDAIFLFCNLNNANFAKVSLQNATFVNCEMSNCTFLGAQLNSCRAYFKGLVFNLEDKSRSVV